MRKAECKTEPRDPEAQLLYLSHTSVLLFWQALAILRNYFSQAENEEDLLILVQLFTDVGTTVILRITEWFGLKVT